MTAGEPRPGPEGREPLLSVSNVRHSYGKCTVLNIEEFQLNRGETFCLLGPSGCGKSTFLRILNFLERPASGTCRWNGVEIDFARPPRSVRRSMALLFQEPHLYRGTVFRNVAIGLAVRGAPRAEIGRRVERALSRFRLEDKALRPATQLSGGEMQRVCLARAFALEPDLLLIDEPFNHLDAPLAADLLHSVKDYIAQCGITALFVTHNRDEALAMADRIGIMMGGSLRVSGAPREVFSAPGDVDVAAFVGIDNILPGAIEEVSEGVALVRLDGGGAIQAAGFEDGLSAGRRVYALIRPELVSLASSGGNGHTSVRNHFTGTVAELRSRGHNYLVRVECGFTVNALITALSFHELGLSPGAVVTASFKATAVALVPHYTKLHKYCP